MRILLGRLPVAIVSAIGVIGGFSVAAAPALASSRQLAMFEDDVQLQANPEATLDTFRTLGVGIVRVYVKWSAIAPATRPAGFNAGNPGDSAYNWAIYDRIVRDAAARGIAIDLTLGGGGAPPWAIGAGAPSDAQDQQWKPIASDYGAFVRAIATRYSGHYRPRGSSSALPRVRFWALWNEPNFGRDLGPQAIDGSRILFSPALYRGLADAGWSALQGTGHGHDTVLIGNLDARGYSHRPSASAPEGLPGNFGQTKPLQFVRALYCVDARYRPLRGATAIATGCPTTAAGSKRFRAAHPVLFHASGFADHPYPMNRPPSQADSRDPDFAEFSQLPRLEAVLDRTQGIYGSRTRFPIYVTEYGYITNPPNRSGHYASPTTAAYYMNWYEYLSWRSPRIATTMQYLLVDPNPRVNVPEFGGFASGLIFFGGVHKPSFDAYRLPIYLPKTSTRRGRSLEVWGCVRPAHYFGGAPKTVQIQYRRGLTGAFATLKTVLIRDPRGYFDVRATFKSSGSVRLAWSYKSRAAPVYSRIQKITVR
jgi:hypothetical protein